MKTVSIQDLKAGLSTIVAEAEAGETFVITRHNNAVAQLTAAEPAMVHRGRRVGHGRLRPALKGGTNGRFLEALLEDRGNPGPV